MHMQIIFPHIELHSIESSFENMPHYHEEHYQITVPLRGSCHFVHENRKLALAAGDGLVLNPQDRHSFHLGPEDKVIIFKINDHSLHPSNALNPPELEQRYRFNPSELSVFFAAMDVLPVYSRAFRSSGNGGKGSRCSNTYIA